MKYRNWKIPYTTPQPPEALLRAGYSPLLAVLLALRGYDDAGQARELLNELFERRGKVFHGLNLSAL